MIERIYILERVDPVIFYGVNNVNRQLIKTLRPKVRTVDAYDTFDNKKVKAHHEAPQQETTINNQK